MFCANTSNCSKWSEVSSVKLQHISLIVVTILWLSSSKLLSLASDNRFWLSAMVGVVSVHSWKNYMCILINRFKLHLEIYLRPSELIAGDIWYTLIIINLKSYLLSTKESNVSEIIIGNISGKICFHSNRNIIIRIEKIQRLFLIKQSEKTNKQINNRTLQLVTLMTQPERSDFLTFHSISCHYCITLRTQMFELHSLVTMLPAWPSS